MDFFSRREATPTETTSQSQKSQVDTPGVSYAESPQFWAFDQFKVATDRLSVIRDVKELIKTDLRFLITNKRLADDATRGGFKVIVSGSEADRARLKRKGKTIKRLTPGSNIAQAVIDDLLTRTKLQAKANEYARALPRDGDLFLNPICDLNAGLVLDVRRAPATTIKRNSDMYGEFPDPEKAFSQIDPRTMHHVFLEIGPPSTTREHFALYQMNHIRHLEDETEMYGTSLYAAARITHKILADMEVATALRRKFRSVLKYAHKLPDGTQSSQVVEYMRNVGLIDKNGNPTRNAHLLSDFVGTAEVKVLDTSPNISQIDDVKYFEELLWLNLCVPKAILTAGGDLNRDVLAIQYPHYLKTLEDITDLLEYGDTGQFSGIRAIIDLQLLLAGINPDSISYDVVWANKTDEKAIDRINRVQAALGANKGVKVITREKAIQEIADDFDIEDPAEMARMVEEEEARDRAVMAALKEKQAKGAPGEEGEGGDEPVEDVLLEDRPAMEALEKKAQATVLRFFRAIYKRMMNYGEPVTDAAILDYSEDAIITILEDAWDEEEAKYQIGIVNVMASAGVIGVLRAEELIQSRQAVGSSGGPSGEIKIKPRITKADIRDNLLNASGERISGIKQTTLNNIREVLGEGFEQDLGWKNLMKQLQPIIVDGVRAEMIARTELSWAYNRSAKRIYRDAGFERVEWSAVIDHRTCPICRERHGKTYPVDRHPDIPAHPRCRCSLLPAD